ncbi:DNA-binding transcriptional regulator CsgD [Posidoniimonas corsicana]|uniref:DNA-binding transcriptional regulator CsgD n=1 Tax=Posidoniimonas corsicana TaxID=1938618 RepID=A0A5C5VBH5_9BACT|nr:helix-turn-helix transcriptional regulator [Posidoniimonas corsicana]TWT35976.1 DNA-binding transcriptional regulator CsgD [Posidoniimonas corsicana]
MTIEPAPHFTERDSKLLRELKCGATNSEAATQLQLSVRTVENHRRTVMKKIGARSAFEFGYLIACQELLAARVEPQE